MTTTDRRRSVSQPTGSESGDVALRVTTTARTDFEQFCRDRYPVVARALALALNSVELGGEAADEAFAVAWERWGTISRMSNPSGWVYRVGLNWGRSFLRRVRREVSWSDVERRDRVLEAPTSDPALVRALSKLSAKHRSVLVAKYYLDWSEAEIAAALDIATGTVKSRLSRAIEQLSKNYGGKTR